jgi:hypothetical protein
MAPRKSRAKKAVTQGSQSRDPFLPFDPHGKGQGLKKLAGYMADASNERGPSILAHASEAIGHGVRDARVFF